MVSIREMQIEDVERASKALRKTMLDGRERFKRATTPDERWNLTLATIPRDAQTEIRKLAKLRLDRRVIAL